MITAQIVSAHEDIERVFSITFDREGTVLFDRFRLSDTVPPSLLSARSFRQLQQKWVKLKQDNGWVQIPSDSGVKFSREGATVELRSTILH